MAKVNTEDFWEILKSAAPIISPKIGEVVTWKILSISSKMILVDLNSQFTGIIAGSDMHSSIDDISKLKIGDLVESIVIGDDKDSWLTVLSIRKASQVKLIGRLHSNFDTKEIITVIPNEANKGWLLIDLDWIKWFIPVSQLTPVNYPRVEWANPERILAHLNRLVGKPFKVRVINVDPDGKKIIFSEKAAVEEERGVALTKLKVGDQVDWVVSGILTYGLFITFSWLEWLVHVSEIDWGHVNDPSKFAKIGDKVKVEVIGIDTDKISLSMKRLKHNPWDELAKKYKVWDIIKAPVTRISKFGIFLALDGWISGLIHLSEISNDMVKNIEDFVKVGELVEAKVITFDPNEKRIGLSLKTTDDVVEVKEEKKAPKAKEEKAEIKVTEEETSKEEKKAPAKKPATKKATK